MSLNCEKNCIYKISPYNMVCGYCKRGPGRFVTGGEYYDLYISNSRLNTPTPKNNTLKNNRFLVGNKASVLLSEVIKIKLDRYCGQSTINAVLKNSTTEIISIYNSYEEALENYNRMTMNL